MYNPTFSSVSYTPTISNPSVHLAVNGNRIKTYNEDDEIRAYFKDGTEFQLEFYNDSDCYVKAEIMINGQHQSSALVLKPRQHFYLDRFMDEKKKFKFNTFLTGNDDIEKLKEIIEKNGRIEVKFYKESIPMPMPIIWTTYGTHTIYQPSIYTSNTSLNNNIEYTKAGIKKSSTNALLKYDIQYNTEKQKEIETGRVETGNKSNQEFKSVYKNWEFFTCARFEYHIMPESQKPKVAKIKKQKNVIQADDIRTYCAKCGRRVKKGFNFCSGCGNNV